MVEDQHRENLGTQFPSSQNEAQRAVFATTHWSVVLSAQEESSKSAQALEDLCKGYWYPLYAYARRTGRSPADAEDLTQGFFARLLERGYLKAACRERGRFRTFLLVAFKRYAANEWDREHAQRRGGFAPILSIEQEAAEGRFASEPAHHAQADVLFDRQWAVTLLERTMERLRHEYASTGRAELFEQLQNSIAKDEFSLPYTEIASRLNLTEAAVKMAVRRLRARYRETLLREIAQTVSSPEEVEEELQHLFSAFEA